MKSFARIGTAGLVLAAAVAVSSLARADEPPVIIVSGGPEPFRAATALVHIETRDAVILEEQVDKRTFRAVCNAPCDRELPLDATYRVRGDGIRNSALFRLRANQGERVVLTVDASSKSAFTTGIVVTSVGGALMIGSLFYGMVAGIGNIRFCDGQCSPEVAADRHERAVEIERNMAIMAGVGAGAAGLGLVTLLSNHRSDVEQVSPSSDAFLRAPPRPEREALPMQGATFLMPATFQF